MKDGNVCGDGSLENGIEVVSSILTGNVVKSSESVKKVCTRLEGLRTKCFR